MLLNNKHSKYYCPLTLEADLLLKKAEKEIPRLDKIQKIVFENIKDELMVIEVKTFKVLSANKTLLKKVKMTKNQVKNKPCYFITHKKNQPCHPPLETCPIQQMLLTGKPTTTQHTHFDKNSNPYYVEITVSPVTDKKGNINHAVHIAKDITQRKKTELELHQSQIDLNRAQKVAKIGSWCLNIKTNQLIWSKQTYIIFGIPQKKPLTYHDFFQTVHPDERTYVDKQWQKALKGQLYDIEHRIIVKGKIKWVREKAEFDFDENNNVKSGFGTVQDITELKRTEQELIETLNASNRRQAEIYALLNAAKTVLKHREFPKAAQEIFNSCKNLLNATSGYVALINKTNNRLTLLFLDTGEHACNLDPSLPFPIRGLRANAYKTGKVVYENNFQKCKHLNLLPKGHMKLKNVLISPLQVEDQTVGIIGVANKPQDFTDQDAQMAKAFAEMASIALLNSQMLEKLEKNENLLKKHSEQLEEIVKKKTKQLQQAERFAAIGHTAGMVGHDMRNPLQAITGDIYLTKLNLDLLPSIPEKTNIKESIEAIQTNVDYISKIIADLQDYAKPLKPAAKPIILEKTISNILLKLSIPKQIQTTYKIEDAAKKIISDPTLLHRIVTNLVINAIQSMPKGGKLEIQAFNHKNRIIIQVQDTGEGIPNNIKNKLFTPLFTTKSKGQGFGLAVVKRLTGALNGKVTFVSKENYGTTFKISLPLNQNSTEKLNVKKDF